MSIGNRRTFLLQVVATSSVLGAVSAYGQAAVKLEESDPQATALGYKQDTTKVDGKTFPKHDVSQTCAGCQLFQGKPADAAGPCTLFAGKQVAAKGWCSAWVKKAA
jgi:hypothetical protein